MEVQRCPIFNSELSKNPVLTRRVQFFLFLSIAEGTKKTYRSKLRQFAEFCVKEDYNPPLPLKEDTLCFYAAYRLKTVKYKTFKGDLSALRSWHIDMGLHWVVSKMRILERVARGGRRFRGDSSLTDEKQRITVKKLEKMLLFLDPTDPVYATLRAAFCTATLGLLRCGEFALSGASEFAKWKLPKESDVKMFPNWNKPSRMEIVIRASKADPFRRTVTVAIGATVANVDAVREVRDMLMTRWQNNPALQSDDYLFKVGDKPLTRKVIISALDTLTKRCGFQGKFSGHSFRKGGATSLALAGCPDSFIRVMGRWSSDAYLRYIKLSAQARARISSAMFTKDKDAFGALELFE